MRLTITIELTRDDPPPERDSQVDALVERAEPDEDPRLGFRRPSGSPAPIWEPGR